MTNNDEDDGDELIGTPRFYELTRMPRFYNEIDECLSEMKTKTKTKMQTQTHLGLMNSCLSFGILGKSRVSVKSWEGKAKKMKGK